MDWADLSRLDADAIPREAIPDALGSIAKLEARLRERLYTPRPNGTPPRHVKAETVAEMLEVDTTWVYRHASDLGGVKIGGVLRFPLAELERRIARARIKP